MGELIKGEPVAETIKEVVIADVEGLKAKGINPKLTIIRVGAHTSDLSYEKGALKTMEACGIITDVVELPLEITQDEFIVKLKEINEDPKTHGILVFRPMPKQLDENVIKYIIAPEKDVDCFSPTNMAKVFEGDETGLFPCTPTAVIEILKHYNIDIKGKNITVIGASNVVGKPVSLLLLAEFATLTICHIFTEDIAAMCANADIIVSAAGVAGLVKAAQVPEGAIVIDVGINFVDGKMCGDVETATAEKASMMTPVPGGVGAVTNTVLAKHIIKACKMQNNL